MCEDTLQIQITHLYLSQTLRQLLLSKDRLSHDVVKGQLYVPSNDRHLIRLPSAL